MERIKQVQTKLGSRNARQTFGSIRVRQGADLVGVTAEKCLLPINP